MIFTLPGLMITVRKPELSDFSYLSHLLSIDVYSSNLGGAEGMTKEFYEFQAMKMLEDNANDLACDKYFLIQDRFKNVPLGLSLLTKIDWKNRHAEHSYIIGDEKHRSKLIAGDINMVMYNYFFYQLNMNKIYGYVFDGNKNSFRINQFGGKYDGRLRSHRLRGARSIDIHLFSITEAEFANFVRSHANGLLRKHIDRGIVRCY